LEAAQQRAQDVLEKITQTVVESEELSQKGLKRLEEEVKKDADSLSTIPPTLSVYQNTLKELQKVVAIINQKSNAGVENLTLKKEITLARKNVDNLYQQLLEELARNVALSDQHQNLIAQVKENIAEVKTLKTSIHSIHEKASSAEDAAEDHKHNVHSLCKIKCSNCSDRKKKCSCVALWSFILLHLCCKDRNMSSL